MQRTSKNKCVTANMKEVQKHLPLDLATMLHDYGVGLAQKGRAVLLCSSFISA